MTLAAVWRHGNRLFAVADTRIVRTPGNILTEHGPKLLPITLVCRQPGPSGFFDREAYRTTLGFAYAGATFPALSTHALANALLQVLNGQAGSPPPDLIQVTIAIAQIAGRYMREVGQLSPNGARFASIIFGFCTVTGRFRGFELQPDITTGQLKIEVREHNMDDDEALIVIGNRPDLLRMRVAELRKDAHPATIDDLPRKALKALINEDADPTVGGALQYGWATINGFEAVASLEPIIPPLPSGRNGALTVLGYDVLEIPPIGPYVPWGMTGR